MHMRSKSNIGAPSVLALAVAGVLAGPVPVARASEAEATRLEDVVVTAQRRAQSLQDVPISITVFDGEMLEANRVEGITDYLSMTPNVSFDTQGSRGRTSLQIRGVGNLGGALNSFGIYVDEFNIASGPGSWRAFDTSLLDLERVEVLRGPQGTLYGRNVTAGAINITTRKPDGEFGGELTADVGSFDTRQIRGVVNIPVVKDKFALRAVGFYGETDGYLENVGSAGVADEGDSHGVRLAARFTPSEQLTIDAAVGVARYDQGFHSLVPRGDDALVTPAPGFYPANRNKLDTNDPYYSKNEQTTATARIEYDFGSVSLVSVSGFIDVDYREYGDFDYTSLDAFRGGNGTDLKTWSQELRLQSSSDSPLTWVIGALYGEDESTEDRRLDVGTEDISFGLPPGTFIDDGTFTRYKSYAVFGEATWTTLGGALDLTAGLRYSKDDTDGYAFDFGTRGADVEASFSDVSPRFAAAWRATNDVTVYGVVSKGYRPGGIQIGSPVPDFQEESLWNYELGVKTRLFEDRVQLNVAAFQVDWEDIQVFGYEPTTFDYYIQNAAAARSRGIELDLLAKPTERLELTLGAGYLDAEFTEYPNADVRGEPTDLTGSRLPGAPDLTLNASAQYSVPLRAGWMIRLRGEWNQIGGRYDSDGLGELPSSFVPERDVVNLRAAFENERFSIVGYAENAFDDDKWTGQRCLGGIFLGGCAATVDPRRYGLRLTARF